MVLNRVKVLSAAELSVWKADADTELPSEGSDAEAHISLELSFEEGQSDAEQQPQQQQPCANPAPQSARSTCSTGGAPGCSPRSPKSPPPEPLLTSSGPSAVDGRSDAFSTRSEGLKAIFLDYDGTLREFEARPELAVPTAEVHRLLGALNDREDLLVHIISGRDANFLSTHFGRYGRLILIAEHERRVAGRFQVWRPNAADARCWGGAGASAAGASSSTGGRSSGGQRRPSDHQDWRSSSRFELAKTADAIKGSQIEEKAFSLVWHYRGAVDQAAAEAAASALADRLLRLRRAWRLRELRVTQGHKTVEVSVRSVTKGEIMRRICDTRRSLGEPFEAVLVAGDDVSDESMFELADDDFLTIKVGQEDSRARYFVDTPEQLRAFLWSFAS